MRKIISLLLVLSLVLFLTSCHGRLGKPETEEGFISYPAPETLDTESKYELTFWSKNDTNLTQKRIYERAKAEFEALYPNVTVTIRTYTNYNDIYKDVVKNLATGTTPNICISYPDHIATYMTGEDTIVPLDGLMTDARFGLGGSELLFDGPEEIIPKFLEECKINANYFAMPYMRSTEACYINADMVKALGYEIPEVLTWDFIFEVSDKATEKNADGTYRANGQKTLIPFIYKSTDNMMIQMLKQKGAEYSTDKGDILIFNDDTADILYSVADAAETKSFSTFKIVSYPGNFFNAGQCIFAIDSTAGATWMGSYSPLTEISEESTRIFETVVKEIPQYDTESPKMISQGPSMCIFNKEDPQEVLYSWLFMQYLLTDSIQIAYAQTEGYAPVTVDALNNPEFTDYLERAGEGEEEYLAYKALPESQRDKTKLRELKNLQSLYYDVKIAATKLLLENTENTFVTPVFNGSTSLRNAAGDLIEYVVRDTSSGKTVDEAYIDELFDKVTSLNHLDDFGNTEGDGDDGAKEEIKTPLPMGSRVLLITLGATWLALGAGYSAMKIKEYRGKKRTRQ